MEGFDLLISHFGINILKIRDAHGRNAFLVAVLLEKYDFVSKIVSLDLLCIHQRDKNGDNALHLAIKKNHHFDSIKQLVCLKISLTVPNNFEVTPMDFFSRNANRYNIAQMQFLIKMLE